MRHNNGDWAGYTYEWNARRHRSHARGRRQDRAGRRPDLGVPERSAVPAVPLGGGGPHARPRDRPAQRRLRLPDGPHRQPAHHAQHHRHADAGADAAAGAAARDPRSVRQRAARRSARAPIYTPIARNCHRPGGPAPSDLDFRYTTALQRDQRLRHRADAGRSRHHRCAAHRAGFGGAFGGGGAHESRRARMPCRRWRGT